MLSGPFCLELLLRIFARASRSSCELPRGVPALWSVVLVVSAVLSPAAVFVQPVLTYLRHARRGTSAYKLRQTFYQLPSTAKPNHVTHAKVYGP